MSLLETLTSSLVSPKNLDKFLTTSKFGFTVLIVNFFILLRLTCSELNSTKLWFVFLIITFSNLQVKSKSKFCLILILFAWTPGVKKKK